jgi:hypothetical protein
MIVMKKAAPIKKVKPAAAESAMNFVDVQCSSLKRTNDIDILDMAP